jgi:hypothetical protein
MVILGTFVPKNGGGYRGVPATAIEINPTFAEAYSNHGNAYWGMGQYVQAIF